MDWLTPLCTLGGVVIGGIINIYLSRQNSMITSGIELRKLQVSSLSQKNSNLENGAKEVDRIISSDYSLLDKYRLINKLLLQNSHYFINNNEYKRYLKSVENDIYFLSLDQKDIDLDGSLSWNVQIIKEESRNTFNRVRVLFQSELESSMIKLQQLFNEI